MPKPPASPYQEEIYLAVVNNYVLRLKSLLDSGGSPDSIDANGRTALYEAASKGHLEIIEVLLDAGARINLRRPTDSSWTQNATALNEAIHAGQFKAAELLLSKGADPRIFSSAHRTAGHILMGTRFTGEQIELGLRLIDLMLDKGINLQQVSFSGQTMLDVAIAHGAPVQIVAKLLDRGANPYMQLGDAPKQHRYWREVDLDVLRLLVERGADINFRDFAGNSLLSHATDVAAFDEMLRLGADINQTNHLGQNTLAVYLDSRKIEPKHVPIMVRLIEEGADVEHLDYSGESVNSMLAARNDEIGAQLRAVIAAKAARSVMSAARNRRQESHWPG